MLSDCQVSFLTEETRHGLMTMIRMTVMGAWSDDKDQDGDGGVVR